MTTVVAAPKPAGGLLKLAVANAYLQTISIISLMEIMQYQIM